MRRFPLTLTLGGVVLALGCGVGYGEEKGAPARLNDSYDGASSAAFSEALNLHRDGRTPSPEMAAARRRLEKSLETVAAQAAAELQGEKIQKLADKMQQSGEAGRAAAVKLDGQLGAIQGAPSPAEFQAMTNAIEQTSRSLGAENASEELFWEVQKIEASVRAAVERELGGTLRQLEASRPVKPIERL